MAATEDPRPAGTGFGRLTRAALALPALSALVPAAGLAEEAPERATLAVKYLHYRDSQSVQTAYPFYNGSESGSFQRVTVKSPSAQLVLPLGRAWSVEAGAVLDSVSGASPRYYSDISGASVMSDRRKGVDARLSHHRERSGFSLSVLRSSENDYVSNAVAAEARWSSEDQNTTVSLSGGTTRDTITPVGGGVLGVERDTKRTNEAMVGLTQALSRHDLAQVTLAYSQGRGYYSDPYKQSDLRPRVRDAATMGLRWNHFVEPLEATLRSAYRYHGDSFGIRAHTLELTWVQPLSRAWRVLPSLRYYTQSSARFYVDPVTDLDIYPGPGSDAEFTSADQRLSAFGAVTVGLKGELRWQAWTFDLRLDRYEQRSGWRAGGRGSSGIDPFHATMLQFGAAVAF